MRFYFFSMLRNALLLFVFILSLTSGLFSQSYLWPTSASRLLSSTFGEFRSGHFHAGIDFKTWGKTGYPVYAIENGSVIRIRVSPYGYGKAIYFQLENGFITVYAHLSEFNDRLTPFVREAQQSQQKYRIDISFPPGQLQFQKGDVLAYTGSSGTGVPHLHFEVRDGISPFNPLYLGYPVQDHIRPVIQACAFSLKSPTGHINGDILPFIARAHKVSAGHYQLDEPVYCEGHIGFAVSCYDQADEAYNKLAVYRISLSVDGVPVYSTQYDRFSYDETVLIALERDFRLMHWGLGSYQKLYREPENTLKFSWPVQPRAGIFQIEASASEAFVNQTDKTSHTFEIIAGDFFGNESRLTGKIIVIEKQDYLNEKRVSSESLQVDAALTRHQIIDDKIRFEVVISEPSLRPSVWAWSVGNTPRQIYLNTLSQGRYAGDKPLTDTGSGLYILNYDLTDTTTGKVERIEDSFFIYNIHQQSEVMVSADSIFSMILPENTFYQPYWGYVKKDTVCDSQYVIYPSDVPLRRSVEIRFYLLPADSAMMPHMGIYEINNNRPGFIGNQFMSHYLCAKTRRLGRYQVLTDTIPPQIDWMYPKDGQWLNTSKPVLSASFKDTLSGISGEENYRFYLDGKPLIVALDPEEHTGIHTLNTPLQSGKHEFIIHLKDKASNETIRKHIFYTP